MTKKKKTQFLKRPLRITVRVNRTEFLQCSQRAKRARLSGAEYARRKILDIPIVDAVPQESAAV